MQHYAQLSVLLFRDYTALSNVLLKTADSSGKHCCDLTTFPADTGRGLGRQVGLELGIRVYGIQNEWAVSKMGRYPKPSTRL